MLGVEGYGSDASDSDSETRQTSAPSTNDSFLVSKLPPSAKKSAFSLPPLANAGASTSTATTSSGGLSLPPPKAKKPKKIKIGLPELPPPSHENDEGGERPPTKKPRLESGAKSSALLSMLPAPKNKAPVPAAPERVLGGGRGPGLVFNTSSARKATIEDTEATGDDGQADSTGLTEPPLPEKLEEKNTTSLPFLPPSLARGKANISVEEKVDRPKASRPLASSAPSVDFFSLGSSSSAGPSSSKATASASPTISSAPALPLVPGISSAPKVDDFTPPEPTPTDPYPGYYLLPSGAWAAYDPDYYRTFYVKWKKEYDEHVRALEKGTKGFEALETEGAQEVNALKEMERAKKEIQELEERKALTKGDLEAAAAPKMNIKGAALGGRARTRHQLSTLLTEAYQNREALEERIAQGKRNRKEAGNKYGF